MEFLLALAIVGAVALFILWPFRSEATVGDDRDPVEEEIAELEARKETVYREIKDAEADKASGKLAESDFERLDGELRREAVGILKKLDKLRGQKAPPGKPPATS
jgi:hypothetical protein